MPRATVQIPSQIGSIDSFLNFLEVVYKVSAIEKDGLARYLEIESKNLFELQSAQNLALQYLGPESEISHKLPPTRLEIFASPDIQRYLARKYQLITSVTNDGLLNIKGSRLCVSVMIRVLQTGRVSPNPVENGSWNSFCDNTGLAKWELATLNVVDRTWLYKFIQEMDSRLGDQSVVVNNSEIEDRAVGSGFIEVYRREPSSVASEPSSSEVVKAKNRKRNSTKSRNRSRKRRSKNRHRSSTVVPSKQVEDVKPINQSSQPKGSPNSSVQKPLSVPIATVVPQQNEKTAAVGVAAAAAKKRRFRPIVIDGANVAHGESSDAQYNVSNLRCAVDYFERLGVTDIAIVLPSDGQRPCSSCFSESEIKKFFIFTPVRRLDPGAKPQRTDDDSITLQYAQRRQGVIVSNDQYRDWLCTNPEFRDLIENRVIPYCLRDGTFMISHYPRGKDRPRLEDILVFPD